MIGFDFTINILVILVPTNFERLASTEAPLPDFRWCLKENSVLHRACLYGAAYRFIVFKILQTIAKVN
jgi:hypothetical protein